MAHRVQIKRTKGFRLPDDTIYVGRPTRWGNPLRLMGNIIYIDAGHRRKILDKWVIYREFSNIDTVLRLYEAIVLGFTFVDVDLQYWSDQFKKNDITELRGKNLACWCGLDKPCHADILIKLANGKIN